MKDIDEARNIILEKTYIVAGKEAAHKYTYGDIIPKAWLLDKFAIDFPKVGTKKQFETASFEFLQNMEGFKSYLLEEHQMYLTPTKGLGYEIVYPKHQSDYAMGRLKSAMSSEIKKAVTILTNINENHLSQEDIRKRDEHQGKVAALAAFSKKRITFK